MKNILKFLFNYYIKNGRTFFVVCGIKFSFRKKKNYIIVISENGKKRRVRKIPGLEINFYGNNNIVKIYEPMPKFINSKFNIYSKNRCEIQSSSKGIKNLILNLQMHSRIKIGKDCSLVSAEVVVDYNSVLTIGEDCMFSGNIKIWTGDGHLIYDKVKQSFVMPKNINIGNHVWVGMCSTILKGVNIPDGCIVGANSVVTKPFDTPNSIICGNPAKTVKSGIYWNQLSMTQIKISGREEEFRSLAISQK